MACLRLARGAPPPPANPLEVRRVVAVAAAVVLVTAAPGGARPADDPLLESQWGLDNIEAIPAWGTSQGKGALVAVIDTGIDLDHPDLRARFGKDAANENDDNGHGTHVAGVIAATRGNGQGGAGVAPKAKLLALKACDADGVCEEADIAHAIRYAADRRADVINLSLAVALVRPRLDGRLEMVLDAVTYATKKGAVVIAAAGNLTLPICQEPAASSLCVGATDRDDLRTFYSNGDATLTSRYLVAPGGGGVPSATGCDNEIVSTFPTDLTPSSCPVGDGYAGLSGTSMAAPFVSGVAALLAGQGLEGPEIVERLLVTADDLGAPGRDPVFGYGRVNALRAVLNI